MDFWDLLDDWKFITLIAGGVFVVAIWLSAQESRKAFGRMLYRICAAIAFLTVIALLFLTWWHPSRVRDPHAVGNLKKIALVTLAADTEMLTGKGSEDATVSENPTAARALAYVQLKQTTAAFKASPLTLIPPEVVGSATAYHDLPYPTASSRRSGLFRSNNIISATDDLHILPIQETHGYDGLGAALGVDAVLIMQTRYELDWDWRDSVPLVTLFTDPYWYGNVRTRAWLVDRNGNIIWRYRESQRSKIAERAEAYNYLIISGSKITTEQSVKLLMDAISESANRLTSLLVQDIADNKSK